MPDRPAAHERSLVVYVDPERVEILLEALDHIAQVMPHGPGDDHPDDTGCARCIADAALAADEENYGR